MCFQVCWQRKEKGGDITFRINGLEHSHSCNGVTTMAHCKFLLTLMISVSYLFGLTGNAVGQTSASAIAGFNLGAAPSQDPIFVDWIIQEEHWMLQVDLIFDPSAGPMQKHFESPKDAGGTPILLDAQQPFPQTLWEEFLILPPPTAPNGFNVTDWHEEIHTPG